MRTRTWMGLPILLLAAAARSATITLDWDAVTTNADATPISDLNGYRVFHATYSLLGMTTGQAMGASTVTKVPVGVMTTTVLNNLPDGATLYFRLTAFDTSSNQSGFNTDNTGLDVEVSTFTPPPPPPASPAPLTATAMSSSRINLSWPNVSGETGYQVERSLDDVSYSPLILLGANVTAHSDTPLSASTTYYYRVYARNAGGDSAPASASAQTFDPPTTPPPAPGTVTATPISTTRIDLSWVASTGEDGYRVERSLNSSSGFLFISSVTASTAFSDASGLSASTTYYYRVYAYNVIGSSAFSAASARTLDVAPPTPGGFAAVVLSTTQVRLGWTDVAGETGYRVERSLSQGGGFSQLALLSAGTTFYVTSLAAGTTYYYRVQSVNGGASSGYTAVLGASPASIGGTGFGTPPGLRDCFAYPNPAVAQDPVISAEMGDVDEIEITIFDISGAPVHSGRITQTVIVNGQRRFEYRWTGDKPSGVYHAVVHGKKGADTVRARTRFAIIR